MFRYGSPFHRFMTLVSNLILLNVLWILTSLPVFTVGASLSALYSVTIKYVYKEDDSAIRAYFRAFKQNFKQATAIWIPHLLIGLALGAGLYYLSATETAAVWWVIFGVIAFLFCLVSGMIYPMLARYENTTTAIIFNSINISVRNLFNMVCVMILNVAPWIFALEFTSVFMYLGLIWTFIGFALIAYLNSIVIVRIFKKYDSQEQQPG